MKAEIIAVGTELLLGQIVNTNAQFLSQQCAELGIAVYFQTVVGDNPARLKQALEIAASRADLIICTGGLGPTQDDLTKDVLAEHTNRTLVMHDPSLAKIVDFFKARNIAMAESNARQAIMLEGSDALENPTGMAVGVALTQDGVHYMLLPGPPKELKPMFLQSATVWLKQALVDEVPLFSRMLKFAGIGESNAEHALIDLIEQQDDPTIAPYAKEGEVTIRLTTRANTEMEAMAKWYATENAIKERIGEHLYAEEDISIEPVLVQMLDDRKETLAVAESCTGGLLSDLLTAVPGSSGAFRGGIVSYTNRMKHALLNIPMSILEGEGAYGAVSVETAKLMAERMRELADSDYALSTTGVAGPGLSEGKPVGLVYIALAVRGEQTEVFTTQQFGNREGIKLKSAKAAFYQLWKKLKLRNESGIIN